MQCKGGSMPNVFPASEQMQWILVHGLRSKQDGNWLDLSFCSKVSPL